MSSELACISTKRRTAVRYSSGIESVDSTVPPRARCASKRSNHASYASSWARVGAGVDSGGVGRAVAGREDRIESERVGHDDSSAAVPETARIDSST